LQKGAVRRSDDSLDNPEVAPVHVYRLHFLVFFVHGVGVHIVFETRDLLALQIVVDSCVPVSVFESSVDECIAHFLYRDFSVYIVLHSST